MGGDALKSRCFPSPMEQFIVCLDAPMIHDLMALSGRKWILSGIFLILLMEPSRVFQTSWNCFHCGFAADYFQSRSLILERTIRDQRRSTQAFSSSQDFTSFLQWDDRDVFDGYCFHPLPNRTVDQIVDVSISQPRRNLEVF